MLKTPIAFDTDSIFEWWADCPYLLDIASGPGRIYVLPTSAAELQTIRKGYKGYLGLVASQHKTLKGTKLSRPRPTMRVSLPDEEKVAFFTSELSLSPHSKQVLVMCIYYQSSESKEKAEYHEGKAFEALRRENKAFVPMAKPPVDVQRDWSLGDIPDVGS